MPAKTPSENEDNFRAQAAKQGLDVNTLRPSSEIANEMVHNVSVDAIRDLGFVGAPCSSSEILPYERPTLELSRSGLKTRVSWLESQIASAAGYDGSISWYITNKNVKRNDHARSFAKLAKEVLGKENAGRLCDLYRIVERDGHASEKDDTEDLTRICTFESDVGFICAEEAVADGWSKDDRRTKIFYQYFDLPNPFEGYLPPEEDATHSWDIVALLGAYDNRLRKEYLDAIEGWRNRIIDYCVSGNEPWAQYQAWYGLCVCKDGSEVKAMHELPGSERRKNWVILRTKHEGTKDLICCGKGFVRRGWIRVIEVGQIPCKYPEI
ncbi:MAG: hypothetical protein Q9228_001601 [Teloschistes exilis]